MTDTNQTLPLNLFSSQASGATQTPSLFSRQESGAPRDDMFSRELSRATDQSQSKGLENRQPTRESRSSNETTQSQSQRTTSRRSDPSESSRADRPERTERDRVTQGQRDRGEAESSSSAADNKAAAAQEDTTTTSGDNTESHQNNSHGGPVDDQVVKTGESETSQPPGLNDSDADVLAGVALPELPELPELSESPELVPAATETDVALSGLATSGPQVQNAQALNGSVASPDVARAAQLSGAAVNKVIAGEQLTPGQLSSRQAQLGNAATAIDGELTEIQLDNLVQSDSKTLKPVTPALPNTAVPSVLSGMVKANLQKTSDANANTAELSSADASVMAEDADPLAAMASQRRQDQAATTAQSQLNNQLAQEQARAQALEVNQNQARQLLQQASASGAANPAAADSSNALPDNMFLSVASGIVTAPVMQRADSASTQLVNAPVNIPILQNDSEKAMASNVRWMVSENVKNAVVNVTPSGMGPISVTIGLEKDQMSVSIIAAQGSTRDALDSMLPRLREQLASQGHTSVNVDISDGRSGQSGDGFDQQSAAGEQGRASDQESANTTGAISQTQESDGVVDGAIDETASSSVGETMLRVDNNGQIQGSYDVYV